MSLLKKIKTPLIVLSYSIIFFLVMILLVNTINNDLYGRLTQTENISNEIENDIPTITLVLKKYLPEENVIESSLILEYNYFKINQFKTTENSKVKIRYFDRYNYNPIPFVFNFKSLNEEKQNNDEGLETENFNIPIAPSMLGFPYDDFELKNFIRLEINDLNQRINLRVQKRIPGRIIKFSKDENKIILSRTITQKILILLVSIIFIFITSLVFYKIISSDKKFNTHEELITIASYLISIVGFREIIGVSRINGISTLEIAVIFIPLILLSASIIYSYSTSKKTIK